MPPFCPALILFFHLVELVDLYPTVADYCGLKAPHQLAGGSLRPLLEDPTRPGKRAAFTLVARGQGKYGQTVSTDSWRYTRWSDGRAELYDEANDREETRNLAQEPRQVDTNKAMRMLLDEIGPCLPAATGQTRSH